MYTITETKGSTVKVVARYDSDERTLCMKDWDVWLDIADSTGTKMELHRDGKLISTYNQLENKYD
jgi:hypothetical protein